MRQVLAQDREVWEPLEAIVIARATLVAQTQVQAVPWGRRMMVYRRAPPEGPQDPTLRTPGGLNLELTFVQTELLSCQELPCMFNHKRGCSELFEEVGS